MDRNKLNRKFHGLVNQLGIMDRREDIIEGYGAESLCDLSDGQLQDAVDRLEQEARIRTENDVKRRRSIVLSLLTDLGVYYVAPREIQQAKWDRVNRFLSSPKIAGKELYRLDKSELSALERKLRSMKESGYYYRSETAVPVMAAPVGMPVASLATGTGHRSRIADRCFVGKLKRKAAMKNHRSPMSGKTETKIVIFRWRTTKKDIICALGPYKRSPGSTMNPAGRTDAGSGCGANISTLYSVFVIAPI